MWRILQTYTFLLGSQSGYVGVVLTSCLNMVGMMQWGLRQSAVMENTMTSVERIVEYGKLQSEAELARLFSKWCNFTILSMVYKEQDHFSTSLVP